MTCLEGMQMGRKSTFTAAQKRDAVIGVISKRKTVSETRSWHGSRTTTPSARH